MDGNIMIIQTSCSEGTSIDGETRRLHAHETGSDIRLRFTMRIGATRSTSRGSAPRPLHPLLLFSTPPYLFRILRPSPEDKPVGRLSLRHSTHFFRWRASAIQPSNDSRCIQSMIYAEDDNAER
jgi:hypothetical protein